jgi:hypothetical protein
MQYASICIEGRGDSKILKIRDPASLLSPSVPFCALLCPSVPFCAVERTGRDERMCIDCTVSYTNTSKSSMCVVFFPESGISG